MENENWKILSLKTLNQNQLDRKDKNKKKYKYIFSKSFQVYKKIFVIDFFLFNLNLFVCVQMYV